MKREEIEQIVIEGICNRLGIFDQEISLNSNFKKDLDCDSLDLIELLIDVELKFDINVPEVQALRFHTVKDVVDYLDKQKISLK